MSCVNGDPLNAHKIQSLWGLAFDLQTKLNGLADTRHQFIEGFGLGMAAGQGGDGGYEIAFGIALDNHIELMIHD